MLPSSQVLCIESNRREAPGWFEVTTLSVQSSSDLGHQPPPPTSPHAAPSHDPTGGRSAFPSATRPAQHRPRFTASALAATASPETLVTNYLPLCLLSVSIYLEAGGTIFPVSGMAPGS